MAQNDERGRPDPPDYKVYRSRRGVGSAKPDLSSLRDKVKRSGGDGERTPRSPRPARSRSAPGSKRSWIKWVGIAIVGWLLISFIAFAVSATIQKSKLADTGGTLGGNPLMAAFPQNILVLGTDVRGEEFADPDAVESEKCLEQSSTGATPSACPSGARADTVMVLRAGGGAFEKLSIPRDTQADVPGFGISKINAAYSIGGAELQIETVEQFLGIEINHVAIVDFAGFRDLIDSVGGVKVRLGERVCNSISNGAFNIDIGPREETLNGEKALALARTRTSTCGTIDDTDRARYQQLILQGLKARLTSITRIPYNFLKGPFIGWSAPKAFVSDMGALTMPQFVFAAAIGGSSEDVVLKPTGSSGSNLIVPPENCAKAVRKLTGEAPGEPPPCSPSG
jgi:LCP family protein required for cell wall assembly